MSVIVSMNAWRLASAVRLSVSVRSASAATRSLRFMRCSCCVRGAVEGACSMPPKPPSSLHRGHNSAVDAEVRAPEPLACHDLASRGTAIAGEDPMSKQARILVAELIGTMILILGGPGTVIFGQFLGFNIGVLGVVARVRPQPPVRGVPVRAHLRLSHQPRGHAGDVGAEAHRRQGRACISRRSDRGRGHRRLHHLVDPRDRRQHDSEEGDASSCCSAVRRTASRTTPRRGSRSGRWSSPRSSSPRSSSW